LTSVSQPAVTDPGAAGHRLLRGFAAAWLRASCPCALCRDPGSGQRLVSITDLPADVTIDAVTVSGDDVSITFGPDGHRAVMSAEWLAGQSAPGTDERTEDAKRLWTAADFPAGPPAWAWPAYLADSAVRADCLATLLRDGMAVLREVPRSRAPC
jgi:DUF971 family protein